MESGFGLFVAVVNRVPDRDMLIRELSRSVPDLSFQTVHLKSDTTDPLDEVLRQAGDPPPGPVMVVDFDAALPSDAAYHPILQALNLRRPEWPKVIPHPVIFWVPEYVLTLLAREAADFLDWRSITVFFIDGKDQDFIPLRSELWDGGIHNGFTLSQRLARVAELESRLALHESDGSDRQVLKVRADWLNELGLHQLFLGEPAEAIDHFHEELSLANLIEDRRREGGALGNLGLAYAALGDDRKSLSFYEQALVIAQEVGDQRGIGGSLGNLGNAYFTLGDVQRAIPFHEQSLAIAREIGERWREEAALGNLGVAYDTLGNTREAIGFYEQALTIAREIGDRRGERATLGNLGITYAALGDIRAAISFYEQALVVAQEIGDRRGQALVFFNLALAMAQLGRLADAIRHAEQSLAIAEAIEAPQAAMVRQRLVEWRAQSSLEGSA